MLKSILSILRQTVEYVENGVAIATPNRQIPERRILLFRIKTKKSKNKAAIANDLTSLRNSLKLIYSMAMVSNFSDDLIPSSANVEE